MSPQRNQKIVLAPPADHGCTMEPSLPPQDYNQQQAAGCNLEEGDLATHMCTT